jgi:hypothetical protein
MAAFSSVIDAWIDGPGPVPYDAGRPHEAMLHCLGCAEALMLQLQGEVQVT